MPPSAELDDPSIETARLVLRRPRLDDARPVAALADNLAVASNLARMPHPYRLADAREWIAKSREDRDETALLVTLATSGEVIGACGAGEMTWMPGVQIGYWLGEPYWGRGYATEAARAMVGHAFSNPALDELWCSCRATNPASRGVIRKCGFGYHRAGTLHIRALGAEVPVEHYVLRRAGWAVRDALTS